MKSRLILFAVFALSISTVAAQELPVMDSLGAVSKDTLAVLPSDSLQQPVAPTPAPLPPRLHLPDRPGWNVVKEGQTLSFKIKASGGSDSTFIYRLAAGILPETALDTSGNFSWTPGYEFVNRLKTDSTFQLLFEAENKQQEQVRQVVEIRVQHVNRAPVAGDLKPMYVQYNSPNAYTIEASAISDEDGDALVYVPIIDQMPEGARLSSEGVFSWKPSLTQFNQLRNKPLQLEFYIEDQPAKARSKGRFKIEVTQQDLPPSIQMVPSQTYFKYKEDATINLKFQLYDPNGESDLNAFNLICDHAEVPASALVKNTPSQYEFIWTPGYDFVQDPKDSLSFNITFYVLDKSHKQEERRIRFTILNAINEAELDRKRYDEYRGSLVRAWDLMEQLNETEEALKQRYKKAKRGKKIRSVTNATLGAATGITPVVIEEPGTTKKITAIGGTAVMTIGTLEATEVIGRSTKDLVERLNYIMEKRNELQTKGDIFARKYALPSARRKAEFHKDIDELAAVMNLRGLVALELDASWKNKQKPTNENIARTFKDFNGEKK